MEVYILDNLFRRRRVIDRFESLIWTERFSAFGDFELLLHSTFENRSLFVVGTNLAINTSAHVMMVETVQNSIDSDGKSTLLVKGLSLEAILQQRVAKGILSDLTSTPKWVITGTPGNIVRKLFDDICVLGKLDAKDILPFITPNSWLAWDNNQVWSNVDPVEVWATSDQGWVDLGGADDMYSLSAILPKDTVLESTEVITVELELMSLYDAIKGICDPYDLGFRFVRNFDTSQLYFNVYAGIDRTTSQINTDPVIFSQNLDNLQNTSELTTVDTYKNVAYVFTPVGYKVVYPLNVDPTLTGFTRRVLFINADDITDTNPIIASDLMIRRGREELSNNQSLSAFDGEVNQANGTYLYGIDYQLGDLVEMQNFDKVSTTMRVTEHIFVSDKEGERSYPTFSLSQIITPGSWVSWDSNKAWADESITEYWENV